MPTKGRYHFSKAAESAQGLDGLVRSGRLTGRHLNRAVMERDRLIASLDVAGVR